MDNVFENVIKYIKEIIAMGKKINVNKLLCLIKYIFNMIIIICKRIINIVKPTITSLLLLANSKLEKYKLVTNTKEKLVANTKEKLVTIKNDDIKLLIKLVIDKTINKKKYKGKLRITSNSLNFLIVTVLAVTQAQRQDCL